MFSELLSPTALAKLIISRRITPGDNVVDATAGNGHDTLFLAELVGRFGKVYSFDIQSEALEATQERLKKQNLLATVTCINDSHKMIDQYVPKPISGAMFNLGYLPGGDHSIATVVEESLPAIKIVLDLLKISGLVTIVTYPGHAEGKREEEKISEFVHSLDKERFAVMITKFIKKSGDPPNVIAIEKGRGI